MPPRGNVYNPVPITYTQKWTHTHSFFYVYVHTHNGFMLNHQPKSLFYFQTFKSYNPSSHSFGFIIVWAYRLLGENWVRRSTFGSHFLCSAVLRQGQAIWPASFRWASLLCLPSHGRCAGILQMHGLFNLLLLFVFFFLKLGYWDWAWVIRLARLTLSLTELPSWLLTPFSYKWY